MKIKLQLLLASAVVMALAITLAGSASAVSGAVSTTDNPGWTDTYDAYVNQACLNGQGVNCNLYLDKRDVWFSGLPVSAALGEGTYFFAVLVPGGQPNPNDGAAKNLSSPYDAYTDRQFSIDSVGLITNLGTHDFDSVNNKLQLYPYDDTTNPGGVYILAVCSLAEGYPVEPRDCKYDAFKIKGAPTNDLLPLTVLKDASGTGEFSWDISKDVNVLTQTVDPGTKATFNYTVKVTHDDGVWQAGGTIAVFNPNENDTIVGDLADTIDDPNATCVVNDGTDTGLSFPPGESDWPYACTYSAPPAKLIETNTATVSWEAQSFPDGDLAEDSDSFEVDFEFELLDNCASVSDPNAPNPPLPATVCVGDQGDVDGTFTFDYAISWTAPAPKTCVDFTNTASFADNSDPQHTGSADAKVTVCSYGPRLTPGYWKNHLANSSAGGQFYSALCSSTVSKYGGGCSTNGPWAIQYLPLSLGNFPVPEIAIAANVFKAMNCSNTGSNTAMNQNAIGCLAGHLLATKLNLANLSNPCIQTSVTAADNFLILVPYAGPTGSYGGIGTALRNQAISLKTALDNYNNGGSCH